MSKMQSRRKVFWILGCLAVLGAAVFLRAFDPQADVAWDLDFSQGINTDGPWYLNAAFSNVGAANRDAGLGAGYNRPFVTAYATLFFRLFGVGLSQLALLNLLPSLGVVALMALVGWYTGGRKTALILAALSAANFILAMFSRTPLIYVWMCVLELVLPLLWMRAMRERDRKRWVGGVLLGLLVFTLSFKPMALFFLPCLMLAERQISKKKLFLLGMAVSLIFAIFLALLPAERRQIFDALRLYVAHVSSIDDLLRALWWYWSNTMAFFHFRMPLESLAAYLAILLLLWTSVLEPKSQNYFDRYLAAVFLLGHLCVLVISYSPLRYYLFLVPVEIYLAVSSIGYLNVLVQGRKLKPRQDRVLLALTLLWALPLGSLISFLPLTPEFPAGSAGRVLLLTLGFGLGIGGLMFIFLKFLTQQNTLTALSRKALPAVALALMLLIALAHFQTWMSLRTYTLRESREDIDEILPKEAVLTGPYAHLLTFGTARLALRVDPPIGNTSEYLRMVRLYRMTHLAYEPLVSAQTYEAMVAEAPGFLLLDSMMIRGFQVKIWQLPSVEETSAVSHSEFETAVMAAHDGKKDLAAGLFAASAKRFPQSGAGLRALVRLLREEGRDESEVAILEREAFRRNPMHPEALARRANAFSNGL